MAGNLLTVEVEASGVLQAFARLEQAVAREIVENAARVTALAVQREAQSRVRRRTGRTASGIVVERARSGDGYVVVSGREPFPSLPGWIEFGTWKWAAAPYLFNSARLEEGSYLRRVEEGLQNAIDEANR